jgi:hypothetical protein
MRETVYERKEERNHRRGRKRKMEYEEKNEEKIQYNINTIQNNRDEKNYSQDKKKENGRHFVE